MTNDERLARVLGLSDVGEVANRLDAALASPDEARDLVEAIVRYTWGHPEENDLLWYVDDLFLDRADQEAAAGREPPAGLAAWEERIASLRDV